MTSFAWSNGQKPLNSKWRARRVEATRTAMSTDEFSDIEITKFNLGDDPLYPLAITGRENPETYRISSRTGNVIDLRDQDKR